MNCTPIAASLITLSLFGLLAGTAAAPVKSGGTSPTRTGPRVEFNRDIRPILSSRCFACHGPDANQRKAGLRLDTFAGARAGAAIVPGRPERSEVIARVVAQDALRMPPLSTGKSLTAAETDLLRRWIAQGADYQEHWSYLSPRRPVPPPVRDQLWSRNPIDRFILARIEAAGLKPSPEADPATLIRRLSFDLTGLPPTSEEVERFKRAVAAERSSKAASPSAIANLQAPPPASGPTAYEALVDRLLASPQFGERMAMYWLDLVRYADTVGYHGDQEQHVAPYRDWVIKAFNDDLSFAQFTTEQLAGDLLVAEELQKAGSGEVARLTSTGVGDLPESLRQRLIPTGYNRVLQTTHEGGAQDLEYRAKYAADRVRNLGVVWMGATTGCTECHDHKFDPYTQKDFYSLAAFFADIDERGAYKGPDANPTIRPPELDVLSPLDQVEADRLRAQLLLLRMRPSNQPEDPAVAQKIAALQASLDEIQKRKRPTLVTLPVSPRPMRVLRRGDWMDEGGELVQPATPHFLPDLGLATSARSRRLTRLDLARWLTSPEQPQTSRVFVNRMWYLLFGTGLCRSLEDAGSQGEWPTHPELLDWLANAFVSGEAGEDKTASLSPPSSRLSPTKLPWSVKRLIRQIVTSAAYRQSSVPTSLLSKRDPENRLFARQGRFRLPAEMIRDNALAVSGLLSQQVGGPTARPYQPEGYYSLLNFPRRTYQSDQDENQYRRGVYVHWQRQYLHPMLRAFDAPSREECTAQRPLTNTPLAALTLLNDPTFVEAARVLATRIMREGGNTPERRIRWTWRLTLSREPLDREVNALARLYVRSRDQYRADPEAANQLISTGLTPVPKDLDPVELAAWTSVSRALLNLSETINRN